MKREKSNIDHFNDQASIYVKEVKILYNEVMAKRKSNYFSLIGFVAISLVIFVLTFVLFDQAQIIENAPGYYIQPFSVILTGFVTVIVVSLISTVAIFLTPKFRVSTITVCIIVALFVLLTGVIINIALIPTEQEVMIKTLEGTYEALTLTHTSTDKIIAILISIASFAFVFFIILILPNQKKFKRLVSIFAWLIIIGGTAALAYSLIFEFSLYLNIIKYGFNNKVPQSFVGNRNPFASLMLTSMLLLLFFYYLNPHKKRRYLYIALTFPFIVAIHFTFSKTNTLLAYLLVFFLFYRHLYTLIKRSLPRFFIELILSTALIVTFFVFRLHPSVSTTIVARVLRNLFPEQIFKIGKSTMNARFNLWRQAYSLIVASPQAHIFGSGLYISRKFFFQRMELTRASGGVVGFGDYHNGFVEVWHTFGFVGLFVYLLIVVLILVILARRLKTNYHLAFYALISLIVFLLRSQTESFVMISIKTEGIIASMTFVFPFLLLMTESHEHGFSPELNTKKVSDR